jgi:hypothetical protein
MGWPRPLAPKLSLTRGHTNRSRVILCIISVCEVVGVYAKLAGEHGWHVRGVEGVRAVEMRRVVRARHVAPGIGSVGGLALIVWGVVARAATCWLVGE